MNHRSDRRRLNVIGRSHGQPAEAKTDEQLTNTSFDKPHGLRGIEKAGNRTQETDQQSIWTGFIEKLKDNPDDKSHKKGDDACPEGNAGGDFSFVDHPGAAGKGIFVNPRRNGVFLTVKVFTCVIRG